ncbi:GNAT family N-acetyltransferase [Streptococcus cameli]
MDKALHIKQVKLEEVELLRKLAIQTFEETFGQDNTPEQLQEFFDRNYSTEKLRAEIQDPESQIDFLMQDSVPVGFLKVNWGTTQTEQELEDAIEIQRIYILKAYQGQGLGKVLFEHAMSIADKSQHKWVWLGVWEHNVKAQEFYKKYGFEKFGEHQFLVGDKVDTDWLMKKALK